MSLGRAERFAGEGQPSAPMTTAPTPEPTALPGPIGCCVCLNIAGARTPAVVVIKGYSVCEEHARIASRADFDLAHIAKPKTVT